MTHTDANHAVMRAMRGTARGPLSAAGNDNVRQGPAPDAHGGADAGSRHSPGWKRPADIALALLMIAFFLPAFLVIAVCLLVEDGRPLFYTQTRIGRGGRTFPCYKFRSMSKNADAILHRLLDGCPVRRAEWDATRKLENDPRIHRFGSILRRSSLDELPQLFNVLRGEMSVVGPRPIVRDEVVKYGAKFEAYQSVRPGLTGLWQVSGRNRLSYEERVALDARYADRISFGRDLRIIVATVWIVLFARGDF